MKRNKVGPYTRTDLVQKLTVSFFLIFVLFMFFLGLNAPQVNDTFVSLKVGEVVVKGLGVPSQDLFSWSAQGREIVVYEWFAQVIEYLISQIGGFLALNIYNAFMFALFFAVLFAVFMIPLKKGFLSSLVLAFLICASTIEFFVVRPQIIAYVLLAATIYLIFNYIFLRRNLLWILLPLTYLWVNSHASFVFVPCLLAAFAVCGFLYFKSEAKTKEAIETFKTLVFFGFLCLAVTFLPPLWYKPYALLLHFLKNSQLVSEFILEWGPHTVDPVSQSIYFYLVVFGLTFAVIFSVLQKNKRRWFLALPFVIIALFSFSAIRHIAFGTLAIVMVLGLFLPRPGLKWMMGIFGSLILVILTFLAVFQTYAKKAVADNGQSQFFARTLENDMEFFKKNKIEGKMYNEFSLGSYLIYYLYPDYKVFFDSRADVYFCCEMRDFLPVLKAKKQSEDTFSDEVYKFIGKYNFSYIVIPYDSYNPLEFTSSTLLAKVLLDDPDWRLIYFSDDMQILAKAGENERIIDVLGMDSVTPYGFVEYRRGQEDKAISQYRKALVIRNSGVGRNGLGQALLTVGEDEKAEAEFRKATEINPYFGKPYLGLGKIAIKNGQTEQAAKYLEKAIDVSPYLGEAYLVLGSIYRERGDIQGAKGVYERGLANDNIDLISRQKLARAISEI